MRKIVILGCIALALLAGLNLWTWRQLNTQREEAGALREQLALVRSAPLTRAETKALEIGRAAPQVHRDAMPELPGMGPTFSSNMEELFQDPEYLRAWRVQVRATSEELYPDIQRALKMSPDMTNRFYELLVDHTYAMNEAMSRAAEGQRDGAPKEARIQKEQDEITALLGPVRAKAWAEYKDNLEFRSEVNRLRADMGGGPTGLRDDQVEALIPVYRAASESNSKPSSPDDFIPSMETVDPAQWGRNDAASRERQRAINAQILEGARSILDPKQLEELERMTRRREELEEASAVLEQRPIQIEEKAAAPAPPN